MNRVALLLVVVIGIAAGALGCQRYSQRLRDGGEGEGEGDIASPCEGAALFVQTDTSNDTVDAPLTLDGSGADLVLFGDTTDGGVFASLKGFFVVGGYAAGQSVLAHAVNAPCSAQGCPTTVGFRFFDTINVTNAGGVCGSATVSADGQGELVFRITGGGTGGGGGGGGGGTGGGTGGGGGTGPNGPDTGLRLTPQ